MTPVKRFAHAFVAALLILAFATTRQGEAALGISSVAIVEPADPANVPRFAKLELLVTLSDVAATKPCDPDPAVGGLDLAATFTGPGGSWDINGFYDGSSWRVRFAPNEVGNWTFRVSAQDSSGTAAWDGGSFTCTASSHPGWARIDGHYLRFTTGQVLFPVGHNTGWQPDVEQPPLTEMAARGENLLSFWLAMPWAQPSAGSHFDDRAPVENAEQGIGNYNQVACAYIDGVLARAEAAGVCLLPVIWSHGQLRDATHPWGDGWWDNNAYSTECSATDFFKTTDAGSDTPQWRYQKNFHRYLIARWGYSRAIVAWVGLCEIEGTTGYAQNPAQAEAWCLAVRDYFRANDAFRRNAGGEYPIAFTMSNDPNWKSGFDLRATDSYSQQSNDTWVAAAIANETETMRASGQPCFHAEFGGDIPGGATQPKHLHNGIWPGTTAGAAMTPLVWCDGGNFPMLTPAMRDHLQYLSQFVAAIDYLGHPGLTPASVSVNDLMCGGRGMRLSDRGFAWVQNAAGTMGGQELSIPGLATGFYRVLWYDVWSSGASPLQARPVTVAGDGILTARVPTLARGDIACRFWREEAEPQITGIAPSSGPRHSQGIITGQNLSDTAGAARFTPDGGPETDWEVLSWTDTQIAFRVSTGSPIGPGQVRLVRTDGAGTNTIGFEVTDTATVHADDDNTTGLENGTERHPFDTIQEAVNAVSDGGTIKVARGTYTESVTIDGKRVTIEGGYAGGTDYATTAGDFSDASRDPDPKTNNTVLDGGGAAVVVRCQGAGAKGSVLTGAKISNGGAIFRGGLLPKRVMCESDE